MARNLANSVMTIIQQFEQRVLQEDEIVEQHFLESDESIDENGVNSYTENFSDTDSEQTIDDNELDAMIQEMETATEPAVTPTKVFTTGQEGVIWFAEPRKDPNTLTSTSSFSAHIRNFNGDETVRRSWDRMISASMVQAIIKWTNKKIIDSLQRKYDDSQILKLEKTVNIGSSKF